MRRSVCIILFFTFFLTGCTDEESIEPFRDYEIRPNVSVAGTTAEAVSAYNGPINSSFTADFPIGVYAYDTTLGWKAGASNSSTPGTPNLINNDPATVSASAGHPVSFGTGPYYFPSGGENVSFYAYAPYGTETTPATNGGAPSVTIALDGGQDVMYATATGNKSGSAAATQPSFRFTHKLAQLQFTFKSGTNYPASGNSVTSLRVKAQPSSLVMNMGTGSVITSGSADIQALSVANQTSGIVITSAGTNANSPVMTTAASGATAYLLDITVKTGSGGTVNYTNVPVSMTSAAGSAHMITVTFTQAAANPTVSAGTWNTVSGGTVSGL